MTGAARVLSLSDVSTGYGGRPVTHGVSFDVASGEVVCMLGPNGAGKTSTLLAISGELSLLAGRVEIAGDAKRLPLHRYARRGLAYVTEERSVFKGLTARDNLRSGRVDVASALELFPELESRMSITAGLLSGGEQQMLTLARALGRKPTLLLADELSLGLAPLVVDRLLRAVRQAADGGTGVLIVEQHARKAMKYADRVLVMRRGELVMSLPAAEARARIDEIENAYLTTAVAAG